MVKKIKKIIPPPLPLTATGGPPLSSTTVPPPIPPLSANLAGGGPLTRSHSFSISSCATGGSSDGNVFVRGRNAFPIARRGSLPHPFQQRKSHMQSQEGGGGSGDSSTGKHFPPKVALQLSAGRSTHAAAHARNCHSLPRSNLPPRGPRVGQPHRKSECCSSSGVSSGVSSGDSSRENSKSPPKIHLTSPEGSVDVLLSYPSRDSRSVEVIKDGMDKMKYNLTRPNYNTNYGKKIKLTVNYVELNSVPKGVHRYVVDFYPPAVPRSIKRKVMDKVVQKYLREIFWDMESDASIKPAYDAKSALFTVKKLNFQDNKDYVNLVITLPRDSDGTDRTYELQINYKGYLDITELTKTLFKDVHEDALSARNVIDIILRHQPSLDYIPIGLNYFTRPGRYNLGSGREAWFGFHHNVVPCHGKFGMVVDVASSAFFKEQHLLDFVLTLLKRERPDLRKWKVYLSDEERRTLNNELIGLRVKTEHGNSPRIYRIYCLGRNSPFYTHFETKDGERINVKDFFFRKYNLELQYPDLPVIQVGKGDKTSYLPMEFCKLIRGQRVLKKLTEQQATTMIRMMASMAPERRHEVNTAIKDVDVPNNPIAKEFNVKSNKENQLMRAEGVVLEPPSIEYNDKCRSGRPMEVVPTKGTWEVYDRQFKEARVVDEWGVLNLAPREVDEEKVTSIISGLIGQGRINGLELNEEYAYYQSFGNQNRDSIDRALEYLKSEKPKIIFVFVVLDGKQTTYSHLKSKGDKEYGFVSQCIRWKSVQKGVNNQVLTNLCMKINHKLGGVNCIISKDSKDHLRVYNTPIIVMGATLSHPHHPEPRRPSVASVVGSIDAAPSQFTAYSSVQSRVHQHIVDLSEMVRSVLLDFYHKNGKLKPHRIIFYRDAIRENMFLTITQHEINAIRRACLALEDGYRPGISFIILQRRHNTRLFCSTADASGRSGNVPAGTCLDNTITHPNKFDFYLASHYGIQGTSRPTYYRVMWDDNDLSAQEAQSLTYMMCYCYSRCTRSVAVPAPTYYAHLAAVRTRHHLTDGDVGVNYDEEGLPINFEDVVRAREVLTVHKDNKYRMYFT